MPPYVPSFKKRCIEGLLRAYAWAFAPKGAFNAHPKSIFVLRNNDRGDLLTTTPLFEGLKKAFPESKLLVGTGSWNLPLLEHNPYIDQVLTLDAPWHNKALTKPGRGLLRTFLEGLWYSLRSSQVKALRALRPVIGIDVLGSPEGAFLLMQAKIPYRCGVKGYAGGHSACQGYLDFDPTCHVSAFALRFLELLGKENLGIAPRPQLYLIPQERQEAQKQWLSYEDGKRTLRIILAPGGGFPQKCWPLESFRVLLAKIHKELEATVIIAGSSDEKPLGEFLKVLCPWVQNRVGVDPLRTSLALAEQADCIICNSSLMMHVGATFQKKTLVLLGAAFEDAQAHERLWSYPATHKVLGKTTAGGTLPTPEQAWEAFKAMLKRS